MEEDSESYTAWHNKSGSPRTQIDYIFMSKHIVGEAGPCRSTRLETGVYRSDHYPIIGQSKFNENVLEVKSKNYGWTGWHLESNEKSFKEEVMWKCGFGRGFPMDSDRLFSLVRESSLEHIEVGVNAAVMNTEFTTGGLNKWKQRQLPEELKNMKDSLWYMDGEQRTDTRQRFFET